MLERCSLPLGQAWGGAAVGMILPPPNPPPPNPHFPHAQFAEEVAEKGGKGARRELDLLSALLIVPNKAQVRGAGRSVRI